MKWVIYSKSLKSVAASDVDWKDTIDKHTLTFHTDDDAVKFIIANKICFDLTDTIIIPLSAYQSGNIQQIRLVKTTKQMKTDKIVVHGATVQEAQTRIDTGVATLPHVRCERQGTKTRLFGSTGGPVLEFRAASFTTCLCRECVEKRKEKADYDKVMRNYRQNRFAGRVA